MNIWLEIGRAFVYSGIAGTAAYFLTKRFIDHRFKRALNEHKQELDQKTELLKHDLQKDAMNAQIAISEKHKIYAELFRLISVADGAVFNLFGIRREPTYEEYSEGDFTKLFEEWNVPLGKASDLINLYRADRDKAIDEWKEYRRILERAEARLAITEARNYLFVNEIYMDDDIAELAHEIVTLIAQYLLHAELNEDHRDPHLAKELENNRERKKQVGSLLPKLKTSIKKKLLGS